ncbi:hypothetical protein ABPG74_016724 [Tetrahymena malaccensis]
MIKQNQIVDYNIVVKVEQENLLQTQNFIVVDEVKNNQNDRIPNCKAFFINRNKESQGFQFYHDGDKKLDEVYHNELKKPVFAIIQKRDVEKWKILKEYQASLQPPDKLEKFIFSLLFYVQKDLQEFKINKIKQCNFSFNENIYYYERDNKVEFKIFFTELYLLNQLQKDKDAQAKKQLSQYDIYCNIIFQLFNKNKNILQEPDQLDTQQIQFYQTIEGFFQNCKSLSISKNNNLQYSINSQLNSYLCQNLFKDQSIKNKIDSLN